MARDQGKDPLLEEAKSAGSAMGNVAKTFFFSDEKTPPEQKVNYGKAPAPKIPVKPPPENYYKSYGAYAPRDVKPERRKRAGRK